MITFLDENDIEHGAQTTIKSTNAVNGERSLSGEIVTGDYVISHIERGWRLRFNDEYYVVTYAKPIDEGRTVSVTFDAVHQFFWDFDKSSLHRQLSDGSHTFQAYLDFIFEGSGYNYVIDSLLKIPAFEKQSFGYKSRLSLFNDIVTSTGVEFQVNGKVVRILVKVGTDLSTVVRKNFNLNELGIEKNIGDFVTYQKGFGAWNDSEDHNKGRLEVEYTSPLASIYGKLEAEPLVDERYTKESSLLSVLKNNVDNSYTISVTLDIEDLTRAGYKYTQPIAGDYIMAINETLDFQEKIRIVSFTSEYDVTGQLIKHTVTCNDIGFVKKQSASYSVAKKQASSAVSSAQNALEVANRALVSANGKNSIFRGTDFPKDEPKGTLHVGDLLFLTVGDVVKQYRWNGTDWEYVTGEDYAKQIKEQVDSQFAEVTQQITEQQQAHDRTVAEILAQVDSTQSLAEQAKAIGDQAKDDAVNLASQLSTAKTALQNSINDTKSQIATVSQALSTAKTDLQTQVNAADAKAVQAQTDVDGLKTKAETIKNDLNTAKSELQTQVNAADAKAVQAQRDITQAKSDLQNQASQLITQAAKQVELTKLTTETKQLADGTLTSLNELSKTVDKNTGNITSVANRTKTVEDNLAGVKTNYTQLNQTVNAQTGQIDSINQKTAQLESGFAGVTERFESLQVGGENLINNTGKPFVMGYGITNTAWNPDTQRTRLDFTSSVNRAINNEILPQGNIFFGDQYFIVKRNQTYTQAIRIATDATFIGQGSMVFSWFGPEVVSGTTAHRHRKAEIRQIADNEYLVWSTTTWNSPDIKLRPFDLYNLYTALDFRNTGTYIEFYKPKLETGSLPTDWCESNTDFNNQIAEYKRTAEQNYSGLQSTISTLDGKITQNKTEANQTATQLSNRLTSLETYKNAEGTRAQAYFEAAKTETAKQITAERSVIARDYTAKSTYTEDVTSIRRTISETKTELGSVTNRTKVVEDDLSGTKTKLEQVKATADTTSRKTADLQSGIDEVTERFENLRVGGRNYINDYSFEKSYTFNSNTSAWKHERIADATARSGYHIKATCTQAGGGGFHKVLCDLRGAEWQGRTMTYAVDIKASKSVRMRLGAEAFKTGYKTIDVTTDWQRFVSTDTVQFKVWYSFPFYTDSVTWAVGDIIYIRDPQLEDGNVATTPHAAEEDFSNQIAEYKRTAEQNYSGLQSTISTLDGKITQNKTEANQTATQLSNRLTSLETYKNAEGTRAQAYFEAAKTETAKQITAERTAITNNYVAKSTYQEDAAGITRRLTATETVANRADTTANSAVTKATNAQSIADTAKANVTTVTTKLATYQETNDRRVAALETAKHSTDGTLTQLSNKVEQNAQQTRETISAVEAKIPTDFGGDNLILEGDRQEAGKYWNNTDLFTHSFYYSGQKKLFRLQTSSASEITTSSNRFPVKRNTKYSLSFWTFSAGNVSSFDVWFLGRKAGETNDFTSPNLLVGAHKNSPVSAEYVTVTFNSGNNDEGYIRFDNNGSSDGNNALFAFGEVMLVEGTIPKHFSKNVAEVITEISNAKLDITKTAEGLKLAATKTELTNAQNNLQSGINAAKSAAESAQAKANSNASTITQHATQITALNNELSAKVSKTDYNTLTGRMTSAETTIQAQAGEISKRLTSTQVESAITAKGYQTKAQVDSNIVGRGYITSSALQPYATTTVLENKVRETVDSFNRTISSVRLEIPSNTSMRNLILKSSDKWGSYTSTNNANSNWCPEICRITLDHDRGIVVGKKLNLFVYISANNVTLDSSSSHIIAIQAAIIKKDGTNLWHADVPFHGQWSQNLKAGNNYYVIKLTKEIKATAYENGATLIVQCRIDGANHVDFHHRAAMITTGDMFPDTWYPAPEDMATVVAFNNISDTVDRHTQTLQDQAGRINTVLQTATTAYQLLQDGGRIYEDLKTVKGQIQQVRDANYATRIETLAGSWAVKNLTSGGQILNQINLLANGINHIDGRLTHITGDTLIDRGVIKSAMIGNGQIGTAHIGTIDASQANIINLNVNKLVGFDATFIKGKFDNVIADLLKGKTVAAQNGAMTIDLLGGAITMRNEGKFIVEGSYAEFTRQEGLIKTSLAFHDYNNDRNGITLSVNDGLGKSTSLKAIWFNERECYITGFDKIMLRTSNGNGIHITKEALEFSIDGSSYILGKTTFDKIARL